MTPPDAPEQAKLRDCLKGYALDWHFRYHQGTIEACDAAMCSEARALYTMTEQVRQEGGEWRVGPLDPWGYWVTNGKEGFHVGGANPEYMGTVRHVLAILNDLTAKAQQAEADSVIFQALADENEWRTEEMARLRQQAEGLKAALETIRADGCDLGNDPSITKCYEGALPDRDMWCCACIAAAALAALEVKE